MPQHDLESAVRVGGDAVFLELEIKPSKDEAACPAGYDPWRKRIVVHLKSDPENNAANRELLSRLHRFFGLPKEAVTLVAGETSREKRIRLANIAPHEALRRLHEALDD